MVVTPASQSQSINGGRPLSIWRFLPARLRLQLHRVSVRRSLRVYIAVAFSLLIIILGATLITFAHERHRQIAFLTASKLFDRGTAQLAADVSALYSPAETLVGMTATLASEIPALIDDHQLLLAHLAAALRAHPNIQSAFVGRGDGDFYSLRNLSNTTAGLNSDSRYPSGTRYLAQSIKRELGAERYEHFFLDGNVEQLDVSDAFVTGFDPREREWYKLASKSNSLIHSDFYEFFTSGDTGITIAQRIVDTKNVFGVDITLEHITATLEKLSPSPEAEIVVFTDDGMLLVSSGSASERGLVEQRVRAPGAGVYIGDFDKPVFDELFHRFVEGERNSVLSLTAGGEAWFASIRPIPFGAGGNIAFMAIAVPERDMLSALERLRLQSIFLALIALGIALLLAWYLSKSISVSASDLAAEAQQMTRLRFDSPLTVRSQISEIDELATSMAVMKSALQRFLRVADSLSAEEGSSGVARVALAEAQMMSGADTARLMLLSEDGHRLVPFESDSSAAEISLITPIDANAAETAEARAMTTGRTVVADVQTSKAISEEHHVWAEVEDPCRLVIPLKPVGEPAIGVIQLDVAQGQGATLRSDEESIRFIEALASAAAVAIRNRQLIEAQHSTFESMMRMLAKAIDAKSPYTGGHCQRVPVLVEQLARAVCASSELRFRDFNLDAVRERELHIASWLHDCGKITTPEHLVDKATKLEGVFNRIHEIRTRFEVLYRDKEIEFLRAVDGASEKVRAEKRRWLLRQREILQADFTFVAQCNIGTDNMSEQSVKRLASIASQTWVRHFDDTLGLSVAERNRHSGASLPPVTETLMADRQEHRIKRHLPLDLIERQHYGFNDFIPEFEHDAGELHNLTIRAGTLTAEERYRINNHVNQTILLLDDVPFPKELARVPRIAGNHHEKLNGSGFPRALEASELEIEDRILTIADVFEALTAADRPYKRAKTLSQSFEIMRGMADNGEIDRDLLELFIASGIPEHYASEYLSVEQIDLANLKPLAGSGERRVDIHVGEIEESVTDE